MVHTQRASDSLCQIALAIDFIDVLYTCTQLRSAPPLVLLSHTQDDPFGTVTSRTIHGWRIHCGVEVTELSTNKQHSPPTRALI
jgi:hypothetical protein